MTKTNVAILGIPIDLGTQTLGVDMGPSALRYGEITKKLEKADFSVLDIGNIECKSRDQVNMGDRKLKYLSEIVRVCESVAKVVDGEIKKGNKIVALGGDHSLTIGTVSGAAKALNAELGLIYIDAHGDFNTEKTTLSGNIHGMTLSALAGIGNSRLTNIYIKGAKVNKENILLVGATDLDKEEEKLLKKEHIRSFDMLDILAKNFGELFGMISSIGTSSKNVWVSLDLDAIDSVYAPGVGIPSRGGLTYREIVAITKYIGKKCNVVGLDIVEYNPTRDIEGRTADLAIELTANLLQSKYSLYTEYMEEQKIK